MKKNGFISTSLIFAFFLIFISVMAFLLNSYAHSRNLLDEIKYDIKNDFVLNDNTEVKLNYMVWNEETNEYELEEKMPFFGYIYDATFSYCKNGSAISFVSGNVVITPIGKDVCYAYFKKEINDVILQIYTKENAASNPVLVNNLPNTNYKIESMECSNGALISYNEDNQTFTIEASNQTECQVIYIRDNSQVTLHYYVEDESGTHIYDGDSYREVSEEPNKEYGLVSYSCEKLDVGTIITENSTGIVVSSSDANTCHTYFKRVTPQVEFIYMEETSEGVKGYTTGKLYSRVFSIPGSDYNYVGSICTPDTIEVTYENGVFHANSTTAGACYLYFDWVVA